MRRQRVDLRSTWVGLRHFDLRTYGRTGSLRMPCTCLSSPRNGGRRTSAALPVKPTHNWRLVHNSLYDAAPVVADCQAAGRVAIIDRNTRRQTTLKAEIAAERTACRTINMPDPDDLIYNERTAAERV